MGITVLDFRTQAGGSRLCPMQGYPDVPDPEMGALNSGSVSWETTCPRPGASSFLPCFGFPTCEMERTGRGVSESTAPLFSVKLLLQEAAGSAAERRLQAPGPVPQPQPLAARSSGPHLLLPGRAPRRPY